MSWLHGHGISPSDIRIEFSFSVRLGRTVISVGKRDVRTPRADVLVRTSDGRNLLIIEVKAPDEVLDDDTRDQGLSYARGITVGNMPPFVVLTNGSQSRIIDTLTKQDIQGTQVPLDHPHVLRGYVIDGDDLALRAEGLELLVSLSAGNLMQFCKDQCAHHMTRLRSDDLLSGKKYLPAVYIDRKAAKDQLTRLLDDGRSVILVIGQPQIGKTNFICHTVEQLLADDQPCLFYPAIGMRGGLFGEISNDFGYLLGETHATHLDVLTKLRRVLTRSGRGLVLFVDGWNEATAEISKAIDSDAGRLSGHPIQLVISLTSTAATRLLVDDAGNPNYLANSASVSPQGARLIEAQRISDSDARPWNIVQIDNFSEDECSLAYDVYAREYDIVVPESHHHTHEPYLLGLAMEQFRSAVLPTTLDEPSLIRKSLERKAARVAGIVHSSVSTMLVQIASSMVSSGAPLPIQTALDVWRISAMDMPHGLYDAALLAECVDESGVHCVDFYYGRERDYAVACLALQWNSKLQSSSSLAEAVQKALSTNVGIDALRWFFRQPQFVCELRVHCDGLPRFSNPTIQKLFLSGLCDIALKPQESTASKLFSTDRGDVEFRSTEPEDTWLQYAVSLIQDSTDIDVRVEAVRLATVTANDRDLLMDTLSKSTSLEESVIAILTIGDEHPLAKGSLGEVALDAFRWLHIDGAEDLHSGLGDSEISYVLGKLLGSENRTVRQHAGESLGHIAPLVLFREFATLSKRLKGNAYTEFVADCVPAVRNAERSLGEHYYGDLCPGVFEWLSMTPKAANAECEKIYPIIAPIVDAFPPTATKMLRDILEDLCAGVSAEDTAKRLTPAANNLQFFFMNPDLDRPDTSSSEKAP